MKRGEASIPRRGGAELKRVLLGVLALIALLVAAGCGGDDDAATPGEGKPVAVRVGVLPIDGVAPLYLGREKGFFKEEGLRVVPQTAEGGAALVPAVVSGDMQLAYSNNISLLLAASKGIDLQIVAEGTPISANQRGAPSGIIVRRDSGIRDGQDLEGKTIGVNTLKNVVELLTRAALDTEGVDLSTLRFAEIPFPEMVSAVEAGRVDAAVEIPPFLAQADAAGLRTVLDPFTRAREGLGLETLSTATYFTSDQYAERNPEIVDRFARAMNRSLDYAQSHPAELSRIIPTYTEIPPKAVGELDYYFFKSELATASIRAQADLMGKYGLADETPEADGLLPTRK